MNLKVVVLLGLLVQTVLYGIYLASSIVAFYCMYCARGRIVTPNRVVIGISIALFVAITLFYVLGVVRVVSVFAVHPDAPIDHFAELLQAGTIIIARMVAFFSVNFLIDCLLTYRLYMIYLQNLKTVVLPILMMSLYLGNSVSQVVMVAQDPGMDSALKIRVWGPVNMAISIFLCTYSTLLISCRIVQDGRAFRLFGTRNILGPALCIIVETAFVYAVLYLVLIALYLAKFEGGYLMLATIAPSLIGINNSLVLIYVGLGFTSTFQSQMTPPTLGWGLGSRIVAEPNGGEHAGMLVAAEATEERKRVNDDMTLS